MATNAAGNYLGSGKKLEGAVPGMTWASFISSFPSASSLGSNQMEGAANVAGIGPVAARRLLDQNNVANFGGGEGNSGGFANNVYGGYNDYAQPVGDGTQNVFTQGPNGELMSTNNTIDTDSWWDRAGLPMLASLAFGGAAGLAAGVGVGVSGAGTGLVNVGTGLSTLGLEGGAVGGAAASTGLGAGVGGINDIASSGYNPFDPTNWTADAGGATLSDGVSTFPIGTEAAGEAAAGGATATSGLTAAEMAQLAGGAGGVAGLSSGLGGGASGTGQSFSDANYSANNGLDYNPSTGVFDSLSNGLSSGYNAVKDFTGLNGNQLLSAGGSLLNGILGYKAAGNAADAQTSAANQSNALAAAIYANNNALQKPFVDGGTAAFNQQSSLNGLNGAAAQTAAKSQFATDPGYQFALDQGNKAIQNSASASGGLYSGRAAKDLSAYTQGQAAQQYGSYYNRLQGQATLGQAAASQTAANGNNYVNNVTSNNGAIGNAQAAGGIAGTNAITGAINGALNGYSQNQLLSLLMKQGSNGYYA